MEGGPAAEEKEAESNAYTYWVREASRDAAPLPVPKKIDPSDLSSQTNQTHLGSAWNRLSWHKLMVEGCNSELWLVAGTWEEKNLNKWATDRIKELLVSVESIEFSGGRAEITEVTKCSGDAFLVTVRNKKRVGYTYELTLKVKGEWHIGGEKKRVKGDIDVEEFSFGEVDDLQLQVRLSEDKEVNISQQDKTQIGQDIKLFLQPLRKKLLQFEE